jgi:hypothetical protein
VERGLEGRVHRGRGAGGDGRRQAGAGREEEGGAGDRRPGLPGVVDPAALGAEFEAACGQAGDEFKRLKLLQTFARIKGDKDLVRGVLFSVVRVAKSDADFAAEEQEVIRELCQFAEVAAAEFGL